MKRRGNVRDSDGFSLAFLDIIACGFAAVVLLVLLSDFRDIPPLPGQEQAIPQTQSIPINQDDLRQKIAQLQIAIAQDLHEIERLEALQTKAQAKLDEAEQRLAAKAKDKATKQQAISALNQDIAGT